MKSFMCMGVAVLAILAVEGESRQIQVIPRHGHYHHRPVMPTHETLNCIHVGMGDSEIAKGITECSMENEKPMGVKSLGLACMGVFLEDGTAVKQGCWVHQMDDVINQTCKNNTCIAEMEYGPYFCCCTTPLCNRSFVRRSDLNKDHIQDM